jgi:hypothetical protein
MKTRLPEVGSVTAPMSAPEQGSRGFRALVPPGFRDVGRESPPRTSRMRCVILKTGDPIYHQRTRKAPRCAALGGSRHRPRRPCCGIRRSTGSDVSHAAIRRIEPPPSIPAHVPTSRRGPDLGPAFTLMGNQGRETDRDPGNDGLAARHPGTTAPPRAEAGRSADPIAAAGEVIRKIDGDATDMFEAEYHRLRAARARRCRRPAPGRPRPGRPWARAPATPRPVGRGQPPGRVESVELNINKFIDV